MSEQSIPVPVQDIIDALSKVSGKGNCTESQPAISDEDYAAQKTEIIHVELHIEFDDDMTLSNAPDLPPCNDDEVVDYKLTESPLFVENDEDSAKCSSKLSKTSAQNKDLPRFKRSLKNRKKYLCKICGKEFTSKVDMHIHGINHAHRQKRVQSTTKRRNKRNNEKMKVDHSGMQNGLIKQLKKNRNRLLQSRTQNTELIKANKLIMSQLAGSEGNPLQCKKCGELFFNSQLLRKHHVKHSRSKSKHVCSICKRSFTFSGNLRRHEKIHQNIRPFKCSICGSKFTQKSHLISHQVVHSRESAQEFTCKTCGSNFTRMGNLRRHEKIHTNERLYTCFVCNKSFLEAGHLKAHYVTHTNEKPYECATCGKSYGRQGNLMRHMKQTHQL
uniref:zinc finger protein 501-like n=1 Tax=Styela clava TaxID=7725 RepID=UPI00193AB3CF|nr:zinc finger protein 501-like [Styela clava]